MSWTQAIQEYAKDSGKFSIPKKDTPEYAKVKAIQERLKTEKDEVLVVVSKKEKKVKVENVVVHVMEEPEPLKKPKKKPAKKEKVENVVPADPVAPEPVIKKRKVLKNVVEKVENVSQVQTPIATVIEQKLPKVVAKPKIANVQQTPELVVEPLVRLPKKVKAKKVANTEVCIEEPEEQQPVKKAKVPKPPKAANVDVKKVQTHKGAQLVDRGIVTFE